MKNLKCITCSAVIEIDEDALVGEIIECEECGQEHELVKDVSGLKLDSAPEVEEDWGE